MKIFINYLQFSNICVKLQFNLTSIKIQLKYWKNKQNKRVITKVSLKFPIFYMYPSLIEKSGTFESDQAVLKD